MDLESQIKAAINQKIVIPLSLPASTVNALFAQAVLETGHFKSPAFAATNSLFNRHKGSGRGFWTGRTYYANPGDADLRIYDSIYQSAEDMAQLLTDPHYIRALLALRAGNVSQYFYELQVAGFSVQDTYASALERTYRSIA